MCIIKEKGVVELPLIIQTAQKHKGTSFNYKDAEF